MDIHIEWRKTPKSKMTMCMAALGVMVLFGLKNAHSVLNVHETEIRKLRAELEALKKKGE